MATNYISKIKIPGDSNTYHIHDDDAIHSVDDLGLSAALVFKGIVATTADLPGAADAKTGDVYIVSSDNSEYVCTGIADDQTSVKWERLGNVHDAASSTHIHTVTVTGSNAASTVRGKVSVPTISANTATIVDINDNRDVTASLVTQAGSVTTGTAADWSARVDNNTLTFTWTANNPTDVVLPVLSEVKASKITTQETDIVTGITIGTTKMDIENGVAAAQSWTQNTGETSTPKDQ